MEAKKKGAKKLKYRRILLKLSGEVLRDKAAGECLSDAVLGEMASKIRSLRAAGAQVGIVIGGGNIFRGLKGASRGFGRAQGDAMGMLATMINSLALQDALDAAGVPSEVFSSTPMPGVCRPFRHRDAVEALEEGKVAIFGGGTGNPFFTTDSAAALRAAEIRADVLVKATKVDGIYTADPVKDPTATRFDRLTFAEALARELKVMDAAAFALCRENRIPILVLDFFRKDAILRGIQGGKAGTTVSE
jgi:uridylate kinase